MQLTDAQLDTLKTWLSANASGLQDQAAADLLNASASPSYWVWRSSISESEVTRGTSADLTTWSWPAYIARTQGERDAWARLFMGGVGGMWPYLASVRTGLQDIFSGSANSAPAQRTHLLAICRRTATVGEKLFAVAATGPGNDGIVLNRGLVTNPDQFGTGKNGVLLEGLVTSDDVSRARNRP